MRYKGFSMARDNLDSDIYHFNERRVEKSIQSEEILSQDRSKIPTEGYHVFLISDKESIEKLWLPMIPEGIVFFEGKKEKLLKEVIYIKAKNGKWYACCMCSWRGTGICYRVGSSLLENYLGKRDVFRNCACLL